MFDPPRETQIVAQLGLDRRLGGFDLVPPMEGLDELFARERDQDADDDDADLGGELAQAVRGLRLVDVHVDPGPL